MVTKPRGGGAKGLSGRATKKRTFFAAFFRHTVLQSFPGRQFQRKRTNFIVNLRVKKFYIYVDNIG